MHVERAHKIYRLSTTVPHAPSVVPHLPRSSPSSVQTNPSAAAPNISLPQPAVTVSAPRASVPTTAATSAKLGTTTVAQSGSTAQRFAQAQAAVAPSYTTSNATKTGSAALYSGSFRKTYTGLVHSSAS